MTWIFKMFKIFKNRIVMEVNVEIRSSRNLPRGYMMSHKKFGPDRLSRFDVYWIQTSQQTDRQAKFIYRCTAFSISSAHSQVKTE